MKKLMRLGLGLAASVFALVVHAELTIEITRGVDDPTRIAVVPFDQSSGGINEDIAAIVGADLQRSGQFEPLPRASMYRKRAPDRRSQCSSKTKQQK